MILGERMTHLRRPGQLPGWGGLVLTVCIAAGLAWALPDSTTAKKEESAPVVRATLGNGLRVIIVRDTLAPVATTVMVYQAGSNETPAGFPGMAHAQEHMMFRGSPGLAADQLADIAAAMGGQFDAETQQNITQYFFTIPAEDLDVALHVEALWMRGVLDTEALWEEERGAIEQEVSRDLSNPQYVFFTELLRAMFEGTPYADDALGTRASFDKTTGAMLKKFYDTWYAPNNAILVIAGNVKPEKALAEVRALFGDIPRKTLPERPAVKLEAVKPKAMSLKTDLPYGLAVVSFRMPGSNSADYAATQVLGDVLASQRGTLYALEPEGKALYADFELSSLPNASVGYALAAFPKAGDGAGLVAEMEKILADDVRNGLPDELVEAARRHELVDAEFQRNSVSGLAMAWVHAVAVEGRQSPDDDLRAIEKVTVADVNRVAREYLAFDHAITAVLTPQSSGGPLSSHAFGGRESLSPKQTEGVALPEWASKALSRLTVPESSVHPVVTKLANGLTLIVQRETVSKTVGVWGQIKSNADLETPKGEEGVSSILDQLFEYGTTRLDRIALQKALDDIGASEETGAGFWLQVLPGQFDRGVELLADNELNAALPDAAFQTVQKRTAASVAGELASPDFLTDQALHAALFPKEDPTLRHATPGSVKSLTLADVKEYYRRVFRPDLTTIVVIGNVTPEEAKRVIEQHFGSWTASGPAPDTVLPPVPLNPPSSTAVPDSSRVQVDVELAETLGLDRFNPDYYALELGNHVLGGGFYATRYYRDLRENGGLVYSVWSSFDLGKTRGIYEVDYACDPSNVSKARGIIQRDLKRMQTTPVTERELENAKALLLREIPLSESSADTIAAGMLRRATLGLPLDEPVLAARRYVKLTPEEVRAAFAKWIRPDDLVQVTEGPAPH
jgi:zinc protease